jgi:hypothetical protein
MHQEVIMARWFGYGFDANLILLDPDQAIVIEADWTVRIPGEGAIPGDGDRERFLPNQVTEHSAKQHADNNPPNRLDFHVLPPETSTHS